MSTPADTSFGLLRPRVSSKVHARVSGLDVLAFFQQLSTLFRAGTPLLEALLIASTQTQSSKLGEIIKSLADKVASGSPLYLAMSEYPKHFKTEWVQVIKSGEESGQLGRVLQTLVIRMDAAARMRSKIVSAMMYPAIIAIVAVVALVVMLVKVVPTFATMFNDFGKELPGITQAVLDMSDFLRSNWLVLGAGLMAATVGARRYVSTPRGRQNWHLLLVSMPAVGEIVVQANMQRFANNVALLLRAGLPLLEVIISMKGILENNVVYHRAMGSVARTVGAGGKMADGLRQTGVFTSFVVSMTRIGEESGTLANVLDQVEQYYRNKLETVVERLTGILETVVIIGMGVAVAVILCAVYLPLFSISSGVS